MATQPCWFRAPRTAEWAIFSPPCPARSLARQYHYLPLTLSLSFSSCSMGVMAGITRRGGEHPAGSKSTPEPDDVTSAPWLAVDMEEGDVALLTGAQTGKLDTPP